MKNYSTAISSSLELFSDLLFKILDDCSYQYSYVRANSGKMICSLT